MLTLQTVLTSILVAIYTIIGYVLGATCGLGNLPWLCLGFIPGLTAGFAILHAIDRHTQRKHHNALDTARNPLGPRESDQN